MPRGQSGQRVPRHALLGAEPCACQAFFQRRGTQACAPQPLPAGSQLLTPAPRSATWLLAMPTVDLMV